MLNISHCTKFEEKKRTNKNLRMRMQLQPAPATHFPLLELRKFNLNTDKVNHTSHTCMRAHAQVKQYT
jgi:hypothetical protein